jgi:hypothetical protein
VPQVDATRLVENTFKTVPQGKKKSKGGAAGIGRPDYSWTPLFISFRWFSEQLHRVAIDADLEEGGDHDITYVCYQSLKSLYIPDGSPKNHYIML